MPRRFIGEFAAAAFLSAAVVLVSRERYAPAGLAASLAVQAKWNFLLPALAILGVWLLALWVTRKGHGWRVAWHYLVALALPTLAFELWVLLTLGALGYRRRLDLIGDFVALQSMSTQQSLAALVPKAVQFSYLATGASVLLVLLTFALLALRLVAARRDSSARGTESLLPWAVGAFAMSSASNIVWWYLRAQQMLPRPVLTSVMMLLSLFAALAVVAIRTVMADTRGRARALARVLAAGLACFMVLAVIFQGQKIIRIMSGDDLLREQRAAAEVIKANTNALPVDGFWTYPEYSVLTDLPYEERGSRASAVDVFTSTRGLLDRGVPSALAFEDRCREILFRSTNVIVCRR